MDLYAHCPCLDQFLTCSYVHTSAWTSIGCLHGGCRKQCLSMPEGVRAHLNEL